MLLMMILVVYYPNTSPLVSAWYGKCCANSLWPSIWSKEVRIHGHHMPKSYCTPSRSSRSPHSFILVLGCILEGDWPIREHSRTRPNLCSRFNPTTLCICYNLPASKIPPSTEHSEPFGVHVGCSVLLAHSPHLAGGLHMGLRPYWSCFCTQLLVVASCCIELSLYIL